MPGPTEIHNKSNSKNIEDRKEAAKLLESNFSSLSDEHKDQAWQDLIRLTGDLGSDVRRRAAKALGSAFSNLPDEHKDQAWQDLIRLTGDHDSYVQWGAAKALGSAFSNLSDEHKDQAWQDLHRLTGDHDSYVRRRAAEALGSAFSDLPDEHKDQVWQDLIRLTGDLDSDVRRRAANALGSAFSNLPDEHKDQAWQDLHRLTGGLDSDVRRRAAEALGSAFSNLPDEHKDQAWQDLIRLTGDHDRYVRMHAYHSLGRASIFKATEAEEDRDTLRRELEAAIGFFEKSSKESQYSPASFCCPFYRSYFAITFLEAKENEVNEYISEARKAVGGSESKDELLKAVENLANALKESQRLKSRSFQQISEDLNAYRWYCDKAAELMSSAEDKAPGAVKLLRKCNPLIEERIQTTITEIQEKARQICQITRGSGTEFEAPGAEINKAAKALSLDDIHRTQRGITRMTDQIKEFCKRLPEGKRKLVCEVVEEIKLAKEIPDKFDKIELAVTHIISAVETTLQVEDLRPYIKETHERTGLILKGLERLDDDQKITVRAILRALELRGDQDREFEELSDRLEAFILELEQMYIEDPVMKKDVTEAADCIKDAGLDVKHTLEFTIPLIPILLTYKGAIELGSGLNLSNAWNKLVSGLRS